MRNTREYNIVFTKGQSYKASASDKEIRLMPSDIFVSSERLKHIFRH